MATIKSTDKTFEKLLKEHKNLYVDFWASWCRQTPYLFDKGSSVTKKSGPCVQLAPVLEEISSEMKDVTIAKHNVEEEPNVPVQFSVTGIPHCILFVNGEKKAVKVGATNKADVIAFLEANKAT